MQSSRLYVNKLYAVLPLAVMSGTVALRIYVYFSDSYCNYLCQINSVLLAVDVSYKKLLPNSKIIHWCFVS